MKKRELKIWHPIIGYAIIQLLRLLNDNLFNRKTYFLFSDILDWAMGICLFIFLYIIIRNIIRLIKRLFQKGKSAVQQPHKIRRLEHELDKIESSLDAVTTNDKVTPIWDPRKKP